MIGGWRPTVAQEVAASTWRIHVKTARCVSTSIRHHTGTAAVPVHATSTAGGADPSSRDSDGTPAVVLAAKLGATESVRVLTDRLATPDEIDTQGRTALMWAAENGYPEIVSLLVEAGSDVDLEDPNGKTALAVAEEAGQTEIAQLFLRICRVGRELSPGESCDVAGAGTVSIRSDGCLGERPGSLTTGISIGSLSVTISDGQSTTCTGGYFESGGFRIAEVPETSRWRIDALP